MHHPSHAWGRTHTIAYSPEVECGLLIPLSRLMGRIFYLFDLGDQLDEVFFRVFKIGIEHIAGAVATGAVYTLETCVAQMDNSVHHLPTSRIIKSEVMKAAPW